MRHMAGKFFTFDEKSRLKYIHLGKKYWLLAVAITLVSDSDYSADMWAVLELHPKNQCS